MQQRLFRFRKIINILRFFPSDVFLLSRSKNKQKRRMRQVLPGRDVITSSSKRAKEPRRAWRLGSLPLIASLKQIDETARPALTVAAGIVYNCGAPQIDGKKNDTLPTLSKLQRTVAPPVLL